MTNVSEQSVRRTAAGVIPANTTMAEFAVAAGQRHSADFSTYPALHAWSVDAPEQFWAQVWDYFDVVASRRFDTVLDGAAMPGARWFSGARLNYADQVLREAERRTGPAIVVLGEDLGRIEVSWPELRDRVAAFAATLRASGVVPGDRVVGYLPNAEEAIVAFLGSAAVGATWAACAPDYGVTAAADRLEQLAPKVLVGVTATRFGGSCRDRRPVLAELAQRLAPDLVITVPRDGLDVDHTAAPTIARWISWDQSLRRGDPPVDLVTEQVAPDHPLWVLFSSGTTGVPKGIVHGHAGVVVTHLAVLGLHQDLGREDIFFWYTTTNWMLWNIVVGALLLGATTVTYEGSPIHPDADLLWRIVEQEKVTQFGTSPGLLRAAMSAGLTPGCDHDLRALEKILVTGAPVSEALSTWVHESVSRSMPLYSTSGGTDVVSSFVGGCPGMPIRPGENSGPLLGVAAAAWDEAGKPVRDMVGELVVTVPMPSMPVKFWNDPDGSRYREAYFSTYPNVWRHGDWVTHTASGSFIVHGRSDSTLNRNGIRIGSADLYHVAESIEGIAEALVLGVEMSDGSYRMPMFLVLEGESPDRQELVAHLEYRLRTECSPRHVPDEFHFVEAIPHTKTGKKLEVPLKRILQGAAASEVLSMGVVDRPELIDFYVRLAAEWATAGRGPTATGTPR
ncbi:acetoacetate--CoA ligase [Gordonia hydrophobica]|uniref:Acetoacetate--CoA ligase n=1 Tax=Gordonia hydrophobica TaxID=40516 RepID=A0ABZ2U6G7_9ACTN|nr:acetoacetate--CoA ligase [Gordonia hydrophobica]MBM7365476.1 acetoacetyl-CoA synthetase [Gordonia hydrophobica]